MKFKKKAFTLVEMIAVIVILAVIILIATPYITEVIKGARDKIDLRNAEAYVEAGENYFTATMKSKTRVLDANVIDNLEVTNKVATGVVTVDDTGHVFLAIIIHNKCYIKNIDESIADIKVSTDLSTCTSLMLTGQTIKEVVLNSYPYLETNTDGCVTSTTTNYTYMNGCYLKGNLDNNYIWYSGFLWRILGINSDFCEGAYITNNSPRTDCTGGNILQRNVGLISMDEYYLAGETDSSMVNDQEYWTMSPYSAAAVWCVDNGNSGTTGSYITNYPMSVRPVINVNSNSIVTSGNGKISTTWNETTSPYILNQNSTDKTGSIKDKVTVGEYVKYADNIYRVVSIDANGNVKLVLGYYYENASGTSYELAFGDNNTFSTTTGIGLKLNTEVLDKLVASTDTTNRDKLISDYPWYQNATAYDSYTVSLNETSPTNTVNATVGLVRLAEILSGNDYSIFSVNGTVASNGDNVRVSWTLTPTMTTTGVWMIYRVGSGDAFVSTAELSFRPAIVIKNSTSIISGNGTPSSPYQI